ncbi:MAG: hypothetical protein ACRD08_07060, partial [Acidimicrobiales bacterium]
MLYDLPRTPGPVKWLVTCLLATFGLSYLFGAWMVGLYAGFTPGSVAATYAEPEMAMAMPPESTIVVEHRLSLSDFAETAPHRVDLDLLVQDTHVHVPMYGVIAALLSTVVLGLRLPRWAVWALITGLFAAPWLDFAGMWLTKLVSPRFALATLAGGWAMGAGYLVVTAAALWQMWRPT